MNENTMTNDTPQVKPYDMPAFLAELERLRACGEAVEWARTQPDPQTLWNVCERGDWMLWLAGEYAGEPWSDARRPLVLAACECARMALPTYEKRNPGDTRVRDCLDLHERWARGEAIDWAVLGRARHAASAASAASADAAASAADAAAYAADAAAADASAADAAAYAADAAAADAAYAAYAADAADAETRKRVLRECADIVRKYYPAVPRGGAL